MSLFSNYKVLPYSINCDTVFLCYNPYYDIQFKQCYQFKDILALIEQIPPTYKIILLAETFDQGLSQISKINRLKEIKQESKTRQKDSQQQDDSLMGRVDINFEEKLENKSSFLHLKCLLNKTQAKISSIDKEIKQKFEKQTVIKLDKKSKKYKKIQQKQLDSLRQKQLTLQKQIQTQQNRRWWKQQSKNIYQVQSQQQSYEDLLSDSEQQKKENRMNA